MKMYRFSRLAGFGRIYYPLCVFHQENGTKVSFVWSLGSRLWGNGCWGRGNKSFPVKKEWRKTRPVRKKKLKLWAIAAIPVDADRPLEIDTFGIVPVLLLLPC